MTRRGNEDSVQIDPEAAALFGTQCDRHRECVFKNGHFGDCRLLMRWDYIPLMNTIHGSDQVRFF